MNRESSERQRFMLLYLYSATGWFAENVRSFSTDDYGNSLVITGRSGILIPPENRLDCSGVMRSKLVRAPDRNAELPFSDRFIVFAYDDQSTSVSGDERCIVKKKRGGAELIVEYLLSAFNHPWHAPAGPGVDHLCDDGQIRQFTFSFLDDFRAMERNSERIDIDIDGADNSEEYKHYIYNFDDALLRLILLGFSIPFRIRKVLNKQQIEHLGNTLPTDLEGVADDIVMELTEKLGSYR